MAWEAARAARSCVPEPLSKPELTGSDAVATVSGGSVQPSICRHALPGPPSQELGMTLFAQSWTPCRDSIDPSVPTELSKASSDGRPCEARPACSASFLCSFPVGQAPAVTCELSCSVLLLLLLLRLSAALPHSLPSMNIWPVKWVAAHNSSLECLSSGAGSPKSRCRQADGGMGPRLSPVLRGSGSGNPWCS